MDKINSNFFKAPPKKIENGILHFQDGQSQEAYLPKEKLSTAPEILEFIPNERLELGLEVGAGDGRCTEQFASVIGKLFAQEISEQRLRQLVSRRLSNVVPVLSDGFDLPFVDHLFDFVASVTVIEHIEPAQSFHFLKEHHRVLKPGGILLIRNDALLYRILERSGYFKRQPDPTHINMVTPRSLRRQLQQVGFSIEQEAYFPYHRFAKAKRFPMIDIFSTKGNFVCRRLN